MTSVENKQTHLNLRHRYRISFNYQPIHRKKNHQKLQNTQTLNNSFSSASAKKAGRSLDPSQPTLPSQTISPSIPETIVSPPKKDYSLIKMTSLYKFVRQKAVNIISPEQDQMKFKDVLEKQIQSDCLIYLEKTSRKNQHRTILHKKLRQKNCFNQQQFTFERSNTF